jgi:hypothetical protein
VAAVLAVVVMPTIVRVKPLLVLEVVNVEEGPLVAVPVLGLVVAALLPQLLQVTGLLPDRGQLGARDVAGQGTRSGTRTGRGTEPAQTTALTRLG